MAADAGAMPTSRASLSSLLKRVFLTLAAVLLLAPLGTVTLAAASPSAPKSGSGPRSALNDSTNTTVTEEEEEAEAEETEEGTEAEATEAEAAELEEEEAEAEEEGEEASSGTRSHAKADARHGAGGQTGSAAKVSRLALTAATRGALAHSRPAASNVGVSFALSSRAEVHFVLARQSAGGRSRWQTTSSASIAATRGSNEDHLHGAGKLSAGHYRLTLTPSGGHSQQVTFEVR